MDNLVKLKTFTHSHDAELMKAFLEDSGIFVILKDDMMANMHMLYSQMGGGVRLYIKESDLEKARDILRYAGYIKQEHAPEEKIDVIPLSSVSNTEKCPYCGSDNIDLEQPIGKISYFLFSIFGVYFQNYSDSSRCYDCSRRWNYKK